MALSSQRGFALLRLTPRRAQRRAAAEKAAAEKAAAAKAAAEKVAADVARLEAQRRKQAVAPASPTPAPAPPAAPESPSVKLQTPGGEVPAPALASPQQGAAASASGTAPAASPLERTAVSVRVQFVQGRSPLQLTLPLPLPTVGELKRRVHEASGGACRLTGTCARLLGRADEGPDAIILGQTCCLRSSAWCSPARSLLPTTRASLSSRHVSHLAAALYARAKLACGRRTLEKARASSARKLRAKRSEAEFGPSDDTSSSSAAC